MAWRILAIAGAVAVAALVGRAEAQGMQPTPSDRAAITKILAAEEAAWQAGDAAAFAAPTRPDVVFTNIVGLFSVGRPPFVAQHERIFATIYKGSTMTQSVEHIALVRPDVAVVDTLTRVTGFASLPPGIAATDGALLTRLEQVMVRGDGGWSVAAFHNVPVNAAALARMSAPK